MSTSASTRSGEPGTFTVGTDRPVMVLPIDSAINAMSAQPSLPPVNLNAIPSVDPTALPVTVREDDDQEEEEFDRDVPIKDRRADFAVGDKHQLPLYVVKSTRLISEIIDWLKKEGGGIEYKDGQPMTDSSIGPIRVVISRLKKSPGVGVLRQTHFSLVMMGPAIYQRLVTKGHSYDPVTAPKGVTTDFQVCKFAFEAKRYPFNWKKFTGRDDVSITKPRDISFFLQLPAHLDIAEIQKQLDWFLQRAVKFNLLTADSYSMLMPMKNREGNSGTHMGFAELKFDLGKLSVEQVIGMMAVLESNPWTAGKKKSGSNELVRMNVTWTKSSLTRPAHKKQPKQRRHDDSSEEAEDAVPPEEVKPGVPSTQFPTLPGQPLRVPHEPKGGRKPKFAGQEKQKEPEHAPQLPVSPVAQPAANPMAMMTQMMASGQAGQVDTGMMIQLMTLQLLGQISGQMNQGPNHK